MELFNNDYYCMKDNYEKNIRIQCATCGSDYSFERNELSGVITCKKCNRVYYGGYTELIGLNQRRISDEVKLMVDDVKSDFIKDLNKLIKN